MSFAGRRVIVTGGSRGIGLGIAHRFAEAGASLVLVGRHEATLRAATSSLPCPALPVAAGTAAPPRNSAESRDGNEVEIGRHTHAVIDLSLPDRRSPWLSLLDKSHQPPAVLVNCAGVTHYSLLARTPARVVDAVVRTNLVAAIDASRWVSGAMLKARRRSSSRSPPTASSLDDGRDPAADPATEDAVDSAIGEASDDFSIVNVASALAHRGGAGSSIYAASKAGLIGFTKALAEELGPRGIRCNAIAPGYVETDMTRGMSLQLQRSAVDRTALRRTGTVSEIADAVFFLATNRFVNGTCLTVDGGLTYE